MPLVEELEQLLKDLVGYVEVFVLAFKPMLGEHAAVQVRDASVGRDEVLRPLLQRTVEPVLEKIAQEAPVEGIELVLASRLLHPLELVAEVVLVLIEKALLLDEVAEHEPVEHDRRIPLAILIAGDAQNALDELVVLLLEALVELLRHLRRVHQERGVDAIHHIDDGRLLVEGE